jgi:hypothetical protein
VPYVGKLLKDMFHQTGAAEELLDTARIVEPLHVLFREEKAAEERKREAEERVAAKERLRLRQEQERLEQLATDKRRAEDTERRKKQEQLEAEECARRAEATRAQAALLATDTEGKAVESHLPQGSDIVPAPPSQQEAAEESKRDGMSLKEPPKGPKGKAD